jgi:tRNA (guanine37-N1)-methyltransferase
VRIHVVTLFPEMISAGLQGGVCGRAVERGIATVTPFNPRDYAMDAHRTVDDRPFGGGPGMVLKVEPTAAAVRAAQVGLPAGAPVIFLTPQGRTFDQSIARRLSGLPGFLLVAGRYEGFDERLVESLADEELSLGDFVLSGGELAALAVVDAVVRLLPGTLGDQASAEQESFMEGLLDCPHYTRPETVEGRAVPRVLLSGDHAAIRSWRHRQALGRTRLRRPELLERRGLRPGEAALLAEFMAEHGRPDIGDNGGPDSMNGGGPEGRGPATGSDE